MSPQRRFFNTCYTAIYTQSIITGQAFSAFSDHPSQIAILLGRIIQTIVDSFFLIVFFKIACWMSGKSEGRSPLLNGQCAEHAWSKEGMTESKPKQFDSAIPFDASSYSRLCFLPPYLLNVIVNLCGRNLCFSYRPLFLSGFREVLPRSMRLSA